MRFLFEISPTPIYQRIIEAFSEALIDFGHEVVTVDYYACGNLDDYSSLIQSKNCDCIVITNSATAISAYVENKNRFLYELIEAKLVFIHHDNVIGHLTDLFLMRNKLASFQRVGNRGFHFCIEYASYLDLRALGIENVSPILHASEFPRSKVAETGSKYNVSFVGHVLPMKNDIFGDHPQSHLLNADFWGRLACLDLRVEPSAVSYADRVVDQQLSLDWFVEKYHYLSKLHGASQFFRGEIIRKVTGASVDIFGGDPAYLNAGGHDNKIKKENINYHLPTNKYTDTIDIYASSKINLNITSLQFDDAVINRVIDVAATGGFVLTDYRPDLRKITSVYDEISYHSIDELNDKVEYYLANDKERREVAEQLHQDVRKNCQYKNVVQQIIDKISSFTDNDGDVPVKLDLGCGPRKKEGFIGVDFDDKWPGVDVAADLTKRFPYPDSSVDEIWAHDVIEHLPDRIHTMNELWRVCKAGAEVNIRVPSTDGRGAFQDPTHVSFWNVNSFKYYTREYPAYLELCRSYGFIGDFSIAHFHEEKSDDEVVHVNVLLKVLK